MACGLSAQGKIYKIVNEDGTISFSDSPAPGAEEITLSPTTNTMQSMLSASPSAPVQNKQAPKYQLSILSPAPDATVRNNTGKVNIAAQIEPQVRGTYELDFGGEIYTSITGAFNLENINRGSHSYQIKFTDNSGKVIASSESRTLHMHQASVLIRNSVN
jgi:hypothetical protein